MLIGYSRVSKSDGSQTLAPQRDALIAAGITPDRIYEDQASGRHDDRAGSAELPEGAAARQYACRVEARPAWPRPQTPGHHGL